MVLCTHLTVAANIFLGDERTQGRSAARPRHGEPRRRRLLDDLGFDLPAGAVLGDLTIGQQQLVATARAAARGVKFLIFDEPTAYLTRQDTDKLFTPHPAAERRGRHHRLYQPSHGGDLPARRPRLRAARRAAGRDACGGRDQ